MGKDRHADPRAKSKKQGRVAKYLKKRKAPGGLEPPIEILQTSALPLGDGAPQTSVNRKNGAGEGVRTLDFNLGKVALYH